MKLPELGNLHLVEIATTMDLETYDDGHLDVDPNFIVNRMIGRDRDNAKKNPYHPDNKKKIPREDPSLHFKPSRAREQCRACKQWGHTSNNCFTMARVYWVNKFISNYPDFCKSIAEQYAIYYSRSQRNA